MSNGQHTLAEHRAYFRDQLDSNEQFWRRFGRQPEFAGRAVLDLGCGHGAMSVEVASRSGSVLGVELDRDRVEFARRNLSENYPELVNRVEFKLIQLAELNAAEDFDIVLSKDTFEHIEDLEAIAVTIFEALKPGGELWAGFSPLYSSPWGDHGRTGLAIGGRHIPWLHAILPEHVVLWAASRHQRRPIRRLYDMGLNGVTPRDFRKYMARAGFETVSIVYNPGDKRLMPLLARAREFSVLERWATVGIYVVARRPT